MIGRSTLGFHRALVASYSLLFVVGCGTSKRPSESAVAGDATLMQLSSSGRLAFDRGDADLAASLYSRALDRARAMDDPRAIATAAYNLAACQVRLGRYPEARLVLVESLSEARRAGEPTSDILLLDAKAALFGGAASEADSILRQLLSPNSGATAIDLSHLHLLLGFLALDSGRLQEAQQELDLVKANATLPRNLTASLASLEGRIRRAESDSVAAAEMFDREAELHREAHNYHDIPAAWARAAEAYAAAGDRRSAAQRYFRAGRTSLAQQRPVSAAPWLMEARRLAVELNDIDLEDQLTSLMSSATTRPTTRSATLRNGK